MKPDNYGCGHTIPTPPVTLAAAADRYLNDVRRIAKKMSVKDLLNPTGRMSNLTVVRDILKKEAEIKKKRTVIASRFNDNSTRIQVRGANESTWDAEEFHPAYPYDGMASMWAAVEEFVGYKVEKIGEAGGEILWLAVAE